MVWLVYKKLYPSSNEDIAHERVKPVAVQFAKYVGITITKDYDDISSYPQSNNL